MKKILITGGAGFIGHHLAPYLSGKGHQVAIIDSFYHHASDARYNAFIVERIGILRERKIPIETVDTRNTDLFLDVMGRHDPDVIIHLAATANAGLCNLDPREGIDMGLMSFCGVLNALVKHKKKAHVIYSSSSMIYGQFKKPVVTEEDVPAPVNIYGASKVSCEIFLKTYQMVYGIPFTIIRPSALYGPRCVNRRVTQIFIESILDAGGIRVSGDGTGMLDFTDIRDLCQGINLIVDNLEISRNQIFNITYGKARAINDLLPILKKELGAFRCESLPRDPSVPSRGTLSTEKIKNMLGYDPQYPIEKGYRELIQWYKKLNWKKRNL
ncbi:MAG: NAD(P)-dependent oxidoreductase [Candidatus Omnitrophica bacterium]|nr:NAD(P)-dependent oxidoreductase [Candidatus Omnitrophota bacterium]